MKTPYEITSNPDGSVELQYGAFKASISGSRWQENNALAHAIGTFLSQCDDIQDATRKMCDVRREVSMLSERLEDIGVLLRRLETMI